MKYGRNIIKEKQSENLERKRKTQSTSKGYDNNFHGTRTGTREPALDEGNYGRLSRHGSIDRP